MFCHLETFWLVDAVEMTGRFLHRKANSSRDSTVLAYCRIVRGRLIIVHFVTKHFQTAKQMDDVPVFKHRIKVPLTKPLFSHMSCEKFSKSLQVSSFELLGIINELLSGLLPFSPVEGHNPIVIRRVVRQTVATARRVWNPDTRRAKRTGAFWARRRMERRKGKRRDPET